MDKGTFLFCKEENRRQFRYEVTFSEKHLRDLISKLIMGKEQKAHF